MEILLITSLSGEDVHGTDNGKKTGCGINLQKAENITRYIKKGEMTDLKELTCEKCKAVLAKRIIKADKKEMQRLIKEEKLRAKKGIEDENIVPLGNTTAKITAPQTSAPAPAPTPAPAPAKPQAAPAPAPQTPVSEQPASAPMPKTIPGTGVAIDNDLAQFAINVPQQEEVTPEPEKKAPADILSQFAIEKPDEDPFAPQEEAAPAPQVSAPQDDFLAQFAIPTPGAPEPEPAPAPVQPEPVRETAPEQQFGYSGNTAEQFDADGEMNDIFTHPEEPKDIFAKKEEAPQPDELEMNDIFKNPEADIYTPAPAQETAPVAAEEKVQDITEEVSDDDIMKMFSISSGNSDNMEIFAKSAPAETSIYDNDENVVDINEDEVTAAPEEIEEVVEAEAVEEANFVISKIGEHKITYPIAFDMEFIANDNSRIETLTRNEKTNIALAFLNRIEEAGYTGMLYGNKEWLLKRIDLSKFEKYDIWLSQEEDIPDYPYTYSMWQYTRQGEVYGIDGYVDLNISFIDYSAR